MTSPNSVRTRIAPSPTGDPHVGTAYIALFNYCFAKKHGGQFILRIEDTDRKRTRAGSEAAILQVLRWLGLNWDEGPDVGGPHGPYRQSERSEIYRKYADELIKNGHAFYCFCTPERLAEMREAQVKAGKRPAYDGHCLNLSEEVVSERLASGEPHVIRMKVPSEGRCVVPDLLRGDIVIDWETVDMQVLLKPDGMPTYHLANVVDDHLMEVTHIIRGEEWVSSAPKHLLLYQYFGWTAPVLCHLPLLRNPDKSKLSKRKNPTSVLFYERMGYLPEALSNYLGLMAWSMPGGEEKFSLQDMIREFDLERVSLGGPVFDLKKLQWLNGRYIRESLTDDQLADRFRTWAFNENYLSPLLPLIKSRIEVLSDVGPLVLPFFSGVPNITAEKLLEGKLSHDDVAIALDLALRQIDEIDWSKENIESSLRQTATRMNVKFRDFLRPFFIAIAGSSVGLPLFDEMALLGREICQARIRHAVSLIGGPSSPEKKEELNRLTREEQAVSAGQL